MKKYKVGVIGAGGRVGLPFSLVAADAGHDVIGIEKNIQKNFDLNSGKMPFIEEGGAAILNRHISRNLHFTNQFTSNVDVFVIMIGTPVDAEGNPRLDDLIDFVNESLRDIKGKLIVLRSTVSPGTTEIVRDALELNTGLKESKDFHLVFCPERVTQGHGIEETRTLPTIIGAFGFNSFIAAQEFFSTFTTSESTFLTPVEAEIGKLMTNMYRYVNFALANEFYMIGEDHGIDTHKVIKAINKDYPRLDIPLPGSNVGGPCLFKDGKFLLEGISYSDLVKTSFEINEGMPAYIFKRLKGMGLKHGQKVLILGASFKAESDDTRNSLSFKMKKILEKSGIKVKMYDPFVEEYKILKSYDFDAYIMMTPHKSFDEIIDNIVVKGKETALFSDIWRTTKYTKKTFTTIKDIRIDIEKISTL